MDRAGAQGAAATLRRSDRALALRQPPSRPPLRALAPPSAALRRRRAPTPTDCRVVAMDWASAAQSGLQHYPFAPCAWQPRQACAWPPRCRLSRLAPVLPPIELRQGCRSHPRTRSRRPASFAVTCRTVTAVSVRSGHAARSSAPPTRRTRHDCTPPAAPSLVAHRRTCPAPLRRQAQEAPGWSW